MQPDPIMQAPYFSQGLNPYAYVLNDPINHIDPSGFEWTLLGDYYPDTLPWWSSGGSSGGSSALGSAGSGIGAGTVGSIAGGVAGGINVVNDVIDLASSAKWEVAPAKFTATPSAQRHRATGATQPGPDAASTNKGGVGPRSAGTDNIGALPCNGTPEQCRQRAMDFNLGGGIAPGGVVVRQGGTLLSRLFGWLFGKGASKALPPAIEVVATKFGAKNAAIFQRTIEIVAEKGGKRFVDHLAALAQAVGEKVPMGQVWKLGELGGKPIFGAVRNGLGIVETKAGTMIVHAPTGGTPTVIGPLLP